MLHPRVFVVGAGLDQSSGGGAFIVTPLDHTGKHPDNYPLCRAHTAPVLDTAWSPFDDSLIASAGEDGRVAITRVDERILLDAWSGDFTGEVQDLEPMAKFAGHGRKAGHVAWNPTADGILASASTEVKIWDVGAQACAYTSETHSDMVQSIAWDFTGTTYATSVPRLSSAHLSCTNVSWDVTARAKTRNCDYLILERQPKQSSWPIPTRA